MALENIGYNTTNGNSALVGVTSGVRVEFQFIPDTPISTQAKYTETQVFGRDHAYLDYGGFTKTITITAYFTAQTISFTDVLEKLVYLESWQRRTGDGRPPERVLFIHGNMTQNIPYRIKSVNYEPKLFQADTFNPKHSTCQIVIQEDPQFNVTAENYR